MLNCRQLTKTIQLKSSGPSNPSSKAQKNEQVLDKLKVERERGITGKLAVTLRQSLA